MPYWFGARRLVHFRSPLPGTTGFAWITQIVNHGCPKFPKNPSIPPRAFGPHYSLPKGPKIPNGAILPQWVIDCNRPYPGPGG